MRGALAIAIGLLLSACLEEPKLKADSESNFSTSLAAITKDLSAADSEKLDSALKDIVLVQIESYGPLPEAIVYRAAAEKLGAPPDEQSITLFMYGFRPAFDSSFAGNWTANRAALVVKNARQLVDGRATKEIFVIAHDERKRATESALNIYREQLAKAKSALNGLRIEVEEITNSEAEQKALLDRIEIGNPRFRFQKSVLRDEPVISLIIANKGTLAVKRIFIDGTLQTPGRSVPWVQGAFDYEFRGGFESGENKTLNVTPSMFSRWASVPREAIDGAVLTLKLTAFEDAGGNRIGQDAERRNKLSKRSSALERGLRELERRISTLGGQLDQAGGPSAAISKPPLATSPLASRSDSETLHDFVGSMSEGWSIEETKSPVDDSPQISGSLASKDGSAWLGLRCKEKTTEVYVSTSSYLGSSDMRRVIYRINNGKPVDVRWNPSTTRKGVFSPNAVAFIKSLPDKGTLFFRIFGFDGTSTEATFDLGPVTELRNKIAATCRWTEIVTAQPNPQPTSRPATQPMEAAGVVLGVRPLPVARAIALGLKTDVPSGLYVVSVDTDEPAARAGIAQGDVILTYAGKLVDTYDDLRLALRSTRPGSTVALTIWRNGAVTRLQVKFDSPKVR